METEIQTVASDNLELTFKIAEYLAIKQQIAELSANLDAKKAELRACIADGDDKLTVGKHSITVRQCTRTAIDTKALQAAHPKLAEKFLKTTTYESVLIK